jgi:phosphohistidine swiveling domain-containing protein
MSNLLNIIKKERWDFGTRVGTPILVYDVICRGVYKYIKKFYGEEFSQRRMLVPKNRDVVRAIGLKQEEKIYDFFKRIVLANPEFLIKSIANDEKILTQIEDKSENLKNNRDLISLLSLFERHSFYFFVGLSCGIQLFENRKKTKNIAIAEKALEIHDVWRNSILPREIKIFDRMDAFLKKIATELKIRNFADIYLLKVSEIKDILNGNLDAKYKDKIEKRKKGFAYLFIDGKSKVIESGPMFREIESFFKEKFAKEARVKVLKGTIVYKNEDKIKGVVKIIERADLKPIKIKGKIGENDILVAQQTDPRYLPFVNMFSAIITDDGGITCHAAIIAREFKIPCIVGTKVATQVLKDGDLVEMDMGKGIVKILKNK